MIRASTPAAPRSAPGPRAFATAFAFAHASATAFAFVRVSAFAFVRASALAFVFAFAVAPAAHADDPALPAFTGYVVDQAHILDAGSVASLKALASRLDRAGTAQLAVATLPSLGDSSVEEAAVALFKKWGLGHDKKRSDGVLILLVPGKTGQRKTRVEVGYGLEGVLPDGKVGAMMREHSSPLIRQDQYGPAALALATAIAAVIDADAAAGGDTAPTPGSPRGGRGIGQPGGERDTGLGGLPVVILLMGALLVWLLVTASRQQFPGKVHGLGGAALVVGALVVGAIVLGGAGAWISWIIGLIANGAAWISISSHRCPKCKSWMSIEREVIEEPTYFSSGLAHVIKNCTQCTFHDVTAQVLPRREVSTSSSGGGGGWSSGGDDDSGGFSGGGGGESGGGGASSND